jgi:hypothetical protein
MNNDIRKITANPACTATQTAMAVTGLGITETLRTGLEEIERRKAYREFAALRGKVKTKYAWQQIKEDRE